MSGAVVFLTTAKDGKHVVRYNADDDDGKLSNAYVGRTVFPDGMPQRIKITIEDADEPSTKPAPAAKKATASKTKR